MKVLDMRDEISWCIGYALFYHELKIEIEEAVGCIKGEDDKNLLEVKYMMCDILSDKLESGLKNIEAGIEVLLKHSDKKVLETKIA